MLIAAGALLTLLTSAAAHAAADSEKLINTLAKAHSWDELIARVEARFPKVIADEFRAASREVPFPVLHANKEEQLVIVDGKGGRAFLTFGAEGTAKLTRIPLEAEPLATIEAEAARLTGKKDPMANALSRLLPKARDARRLGPGMALVALAGADLWKAEACAGTELSKHLMQTCPLMGVGLMLPLSATEGPVRAKEPFRPVSLRCPAENGGVLELIRKNSAGQTSRIRVKYETVDAVQATAELAEAGKYFELLQAYRIKEQPLAHLKAQGSELLRPIHPIKAEICDGPAENLARYRALLEANRQQMKVAEKAAESSASEIGLNAR